MEHSPAVDAARHFLSVACDGRAPSDAQMSEALDRLVSAYHLTPDAAPSGSEWIAPPGDGPAHFERIGARFPTYGYYPLADPTEAPDSPSSIGDAVDDLGDIITDMREVIWLADNIGFNDANWSFRLHFFHWGTHARDLLRYLHGRQFG